MLHSTLARAHTLLLWAAGLYIAFLGCLTLEPVQRHLIYLHKLSFPFGADFTRPELYGFAPGKVRPLNLTASDGVRISAWQVLPSTFYQEYITSHGVPSSGPLPQSAFDSAALSHPFVLYAHGNAGTRALSNRVKVAQMVTNMDANFLIIDYRGFADSEAVPPTEAGLVRDLRAGWDLLIAKGVKPSEITVMGQSLGTGVSSATVAELAREGTTPNGLILVAPFSSVWSLLGTYRLFNTVPLLGPLRHYPTLMNLFVPFLSTKFDTSSVINTIECPILLLHAQDDPVIPHTHSTTLAGLLDHAGAHEVDEKSMGGWGTISRWKRAKGGDITWGEAVVGGHNTIGTTEVSASLIREIIYRARAD